MSTSLFALLDDIASVLDDVALTTKLATKKTAGVLGDDLALNAKQVSGTAADRELPVVFAVAKGSALNKVVLVPAALLLSEFLPWLVMPLLVLGGAFLCYEGVHKLLEGLARRRGGAAEPQPDAPVEDEATKIKGAIRTDFILSAEIVVISLGAVADATLAIKALTLAAVSVVATVGIYGLVAGIVKLDDLGLLLQDSKSAALRLVSRGLLRASPLLMRALSVIGIAAVFLVGGGIVTHAVERLEHWSLDLRTALSESELGATLAPFAAAAFDALVGLCVGAISLLLVRGVSKAAAAFR